MEDKLIVAISSYATCGKDTLCKIFVEKFRRKNIAARRVAFADPLKEEIRPILIAKYQIDILNCSPEEKEKVRPEIVGFAKKKREETSGAYFVEKLSKEVESSKDKVFIISDLRFAHYPEKDEFFGSNLEAEV